MIYKVNLIRQSSVGIDATSEEEAIKSAKSLFPNESYENIKIFIETSHLRNKADEFIERAMENINSSNLILYFCDFSICDDEMCLTGCYFGEFIFDEYAIEKLKIIRANTKNEAIALMQRCRISAENYSIIKNITFTTCLAEKDFGNRYFCSIDISFDITRVGNDIEESLRQFQEIIKELQK